MFISILKIALAGILGSMLLFIIPFLIFKAVIFFLILGLVFRLFGRRRYYGRWRRYHPYFTEYSDESASFGGKESLRDRAIDGPKQV
jgi:hypothetical protein